MAQTRQGTETWRVWKLVCIRGDGHGGVEAGDIFEVERMNLPANPTGKAITSRLRLSDLAPFAPWVVTEDGSGLITVSDAGGWPMYILERLGHGAA